MFWYETIKQSSSVCCYDNSGYHTYNYWPLPSYIDDESRNWATECFGYSNFLLENRILVMTDIGFPSFDQFIAIFGFWHWNWNIKNWSWSIFPFSVFKSQYQISKNVSILPVNFPVFGPVNTPILPDLSTLPCYQTCQLSHITRTFQHFSCSNLGS